jgi:hypothetical protein
VGKKLPPAQLALYEQIDRLLWDAWDPIGISGNLNARDEYYGYLPGIFALALDRCDVREIADRLHSIETINMGLIGNRDHCEWVAQQICAARDELIERHA